MEENDLFKGLESFLTASPENINQNMINNEKPEEVSGEDTNKDKPVGFSLEELETEVEAEEVAEEVTETEETEEVKPEEVIENTDNADVYKSLSEFLKSEGVLTDGEFDSPETMVNTFKQVIDRNIEDWKEGLPEEIHKLIDNYQAGVPFDKLLEVSSKQIEYSNIDEATLEEDLDLQRKLAEDYLRATTKFSEARIKKEIQSKEDSNELEEFSKEGLGTLKEELEKTIAAEKARVKEQEAIAKEERAKQLNFLNKQITEINEIVPGVKISDTEKKELLKMITTAVEIRGDQAFTQAMVTREKDPIGFETKLNYYIKMGLFDEKPNFETIMKKTTTKTVEKLERKLEETMKKRFNIHSSNNIQNIESDVLKAASTIFK
jgi:hypothetical protein